MKLLKSSKMNELIPLEFHLSQNYPNPFKEKTIIKYCVAYKSEVTLRVMNSENKLIEILVKEEKEAGTYEIEFSAKGRSASGEDAGSLSDGSYFYELETKGYVSKKMMILHCK